MIAFRLTIALLSIVAFAGSNQKAHCQNLSNVLEGFTFNRVPSDRPVVGAKWVDGMGATTQGLPPEKLVNARSLNTYSFDKETNAALAFSFKTIAGLDGYKASDLEVNLSKMYIESVKDLYALPLSKGESFVYEAVKVESVDVTFSEAIEAGVKAKLPANLSVVSIDALGDNKKRMTLSGENLYVAFKIVRLNKVVDEVKSKKINDDFKVLNLMGYDISFNNDRLLNAAIKSTREELGDERFKKLLYFENSIKKYAKLKPITMSLISSQRGDMSSGVFNKVIDFCYCKTFGDVSGRMFLVNSTNTGSKITFEYVVLEDYLITYRAMPGVSSRDGDPLGFLTPGKYSKVSLVTKEYYISSVSK